MAELRRGTIEEGKDGKKYIFLGGDRYDRASWTEAPLIPSMKDVESTFKGPQDALRALITGSIAAPVSGLTGLVASAYPGPSGQGADVAERTRQALTYSPGPEGQQIVSDVTAPLRWWSEKAEEAGGTATDKFNPLVGTGVRAGLEFLPSIIAKAAKPQIAKIRGRAEINAAGLTADRLTKNDTWLRAQEEGYKVPPSAMGGGFISNRIESVGGKAAVGQDFSIHNQAITNKIARREAGLRPEQPITEKNLADARHAMAEPYRRVAQLSPVANRALERLQDARAQSKLYWKYYNTSTKPSAMRRAKAFDTQAGLLEKLIEREARKAGHPELVDQLRTARVNIAKNHTVDRALNIGSGEVDAHAMGNMLDQGQKMSGGLETVARFAQAFRPYSREASMVPTPGVSKSEALASAALGMGGQAGGMGWWPAGLPFVSPAARAMLRSPFMQPGAQALPQVPLGVRALTAATSRPELYTLMPGLGLVGVPPEEYEPSLRSR